MIHITTDTKKIAKDAWDFPLEELGYLTEEHDGETFVLSGDRLFEAEEE